jgi:hypothetical protein
LEAYQEEERIEIEEGGRSLDWVLDDKKYDLLSLLLPGVVSLLPHHQCQSLTARRVFQTYHIFYAPLILCLAVH